MSGVGDLVHGPVQHHRLPVAVVRVDTSGEGVPIGIQIAGKPFQEHVAVAVGLVLEGEIGGFVAPEI